LELCHNLSIPLLLLPVLVREKLPVRKLRRLLALLLLPLLLLLFSLTNPVQIAGLIAYGGAMG
jgi:hypothetical protein